MTTTGWLFLACCWTLMTFLTVWCFSKILGPQRKPR
jgi:hypothetical protein